MKFSKFSGIIAGAVVLVSLGFYVGLQQPRQRKSAEIPEAKVTLGHNYFNYKMVGEPPNVEFVPNIPQGDLPGAYLKAFTVAYEDFKKLSDLSARKKELSSYTIGMRLSPDGKDYYVTFTPVYVPPKSGVIEMEVNRIVGYTIRISDFSITERSYGT